MVQAKAAASPAECRTAFERLVVASLAAADQLQKSLNDERLALERQDSDALGQAANAKQECVATLETLEQERRAISAAAGFASGPEQMPALIAWCDGGNRIIEDWERFLVIAADCDRMNTANGAIIHLKRQHYAAALRIVGGSATGTIETYGPSGGDAAIRSPRALAEI